MRIPRTEITRAYVLEQPAQRRRLMGTAMPGLYEGRWSFAETDRITRYCTTLSRVVVLETAGGKWGRTTYRINPADRRLTGANRFPAMPTCYRLKERACALH